MKASKGAKMTALMGQSFGTFTIIVYYLNWLSNLRHQAVFCSGIVSVCWDAIYAGAVPQLTPLARPLAPAALLRGIMEPGHNAAQLDLHIGGLCGVAPRLWPVFLNSPCNPLKLGLPGGRSGEVVSQV